MRINQLKIPAYGPFSDFSLDLPKGDADFHIIYGPNEAGKSSLLRAIRSLLFGIPGQTTDNFKHDYDLLLSSFEVSLADTSHPEEWEYENVDDPEYYPRPTYRNNDVDGLLATVSGPGWSQRWM